MLISWMLPWEIYRYRSILIAPLDCCNSGYVALYTVSYLQTSALRAISLIILHLVISLNQLAISLYELAILLNELEISMKELGISMIELTILLNELAISPNE